MVKIGNNKIKDNKDIKNNKDKAIKEHIPTQTLSSKEILEELVQKQLKNVPTNKKLRYNDLVRVCKLISHSIFDENVCSVWKNYAGDKYSTNKALRAPYINFYFRKKKTALHRLLYVNYVGALSTKEYLKFSCPNKGRCCNINHIKKFGYKDVDGGDDSTEQSSESLSKSEKINQMSGSIDEDKLNISFEL